MNPNNILDIIKNHIPNIYNNNNNIIINPKKIDKGSAGRIYLININHNKYVCKMTSCDYEMEATIMKNLNHPNIIKYYGSHKTDIMYLFMEYIEGYSLYDWLHKKNLTTNTSKLVITKIVNGIKYLHDNNIVHRDIKLENIMINPITSDIKIIDFGFSIIWTSNMPLLTKYCGSIHYASPEILNSIPYKGMPIDIWSLGILTYIIFSSSMYYPFDDHNDNFENLKYKICFEEPNYNKIKYKSIIPLIQNMIKKEPDNRSTINDIYKILCPGQDVLHNTDTDT